MNKLMILLVL